MANLVEIGDIHTHPYVLKSLGETKSQLTDSNIISTISGVSGHGEHGTCRKANCTWSGPWRVLPCERLFESHIPAAEPPILSQFPHQTLGINVKVDGQSVSLSVCLCLGPVTNFSPSLFNYFRQLWI
jgi:hypothetical protein